MDQQSPAPSFVDSLAGMKGLLGGLFGARNLALGSPRAKIFSTRMEPSLAHSPSMEHTFGANMSGDMISNMGSAVIQHLARTVSPLIAWVWMFLLPSDMGSGVAP